ncbi:gamma-glutamyl-gamma-aminobutyrate hydrolase family protein [Actinomadura kijaniata]|uniref:gamma-glutamyl-gamma-aminobutyrate hydrolase family protein n=1 Tax=Actinomadura kijaniata TaxID=46161 RepID=UPI00082BCF39|nr:gamma-glutamyl-gamma-aminobutyrate hydrolase family protein [Actinomadura kijaniata]
MRPLIAVAGLRSPRIEGLRFDGVVAAAAVLEAVHRAGGEPAILYHGRPGDLPGRLARFDGVVLPGGRDMNPRRYGARPHERTEPPDDVQDEADLAVVRAVLARGMPMLAICRGMQVLNVACGGTLVQHLPDTGVTHLGAFHEVTLDPGSRTARVLGADTVSVSSYHHQAVDEVGRGLRVVGRAPDGCVEALEHDLAPVLAVQWHPEDDAETTPYEQALFDAVVEDAARHRLEELPS